MKHDWILIMLALICMAVLIAMPAKVEAQELPQVPAAVQTRTAEIVGKAKELGRGEQAQEAADSVAAFRATAQASLSTQLDPILVQPTRIPRGNGQRLYRCLQQRYDRNSRTWICVRTGR